VSDAISALRARVRIETLTRVADEIGGAALAWADQGEAWAEIVVGGAGQAEAYDSTRGSTTIIVRLRRRDADWLRSRIMRGDATYRVRAVRDGGGPRIELVCEEEML
jgi:head-tail adaptor